jgi:hypothetical protein
MRTRHPGFAWLSGRKDYSSPWEGLRIPALLTNTTDDADAIRAFGQEQQQPSRP